MSQTLERILRIAHYTDIRPEHTVRPNIRYAKASVDSSIDPIHIFNRCQICGKFYTQKWNLNDTCIEVHKEEVTAVNNAAAIIWLRLIRNDMRMVSMKQ